ncbi:MAG: hypothetical protein ACKVW3_10825 [Phycisphaerales bacterium]
MLARLLCLSVLLLAGCNIVAPAYYFIHGPEKTPAAYTIPPKSKATVFIDDRSNVLPRIALRDAIGRQTQQVLLKQRALTDMVDAMSTRQTATAKDRAGSPLSITELGRAVGADVVIYATVDQFALTQDGESLSPVASLRVKVVDATNDKRSWPEDPRGQSLVIRPKASAAAPPRGAGARLKAEEELAVLVGQRLAELFYKHETPKGVSVPN